MNNNSSFIYILVDKNQQRIKIGKADDIIRRIQSLEYTWGQFNLEQSIQIKCKKKYVYKLENILHNIFYTWNILLEDKKDGHTEWFSINCLENVNNIIHMIKKAQVDDSIEIQEGIETLVLNFKKTNWFNDLSKDERKKYREDKKKKEVANYYKLAAEFETINIQTSDKLIDLLLNIQHEILSIDTLSKEIVFKNTSYIYNIFFRKMPELSTFLYDDIGENNKITADSSGETYRLIKDISIYSNQEEKIYVKINCDFQYYIKYKELKIPLTTLSNYFSKNFNISC